MLSLCKRVLVLAAHPDDEVLGVGGSIPLLKKHGAGVEVVFVTDGTSTQYAGDNEMQTRRRSSLERANEMLGTDEIHYLDFPDMRLDTVPHAELNQALESIVGRGSFDTLFVHHGGDLNLDHALVHRSALVVSRPRPAQSIHRVLTYRVNSSTEWGAKTTGTFFRPSYYVDIESTIETKLAAMECYADELFRSPHPRSLEMIRSRAAVEGSEVGVLYAEAFGVERICDVF